MTPVDPDGSALRRAAHKCLDESKRASSEKVKTTLRSVAKQLYQAASVTSQTLNSHES